MKAIVCPRYGGPETLEYREVPDPVAKDDRVLLRVHATSVNPADWHYMRGAPAIARLMFGLTRPRKEVLGFDVAGTVEAVGPEASAFRVGDRVFGTVPFDGRGAGGFSELALVPGDDLAKVPAGVSLEDAAALPIAGCTALQALRDWARVRAGQKVLVNGASGGVGTFAVQLARHFGAEVTGVCSGANVDLVRSLGADHVIDYTTADFTAGPAKYDLIVEAAGFRSVRETRRALAPAGTLAFVGGSSKGLVEAMLLGPALVRGGRRIVQKVATSGASDLMALAGLVAEGRVRPVIGRRFPLAQGAEAVRLVEGGHARGKVVIVVREESTSESGRP